MQDVKVRRTVFAFLLLVVLVELIRTAWISDDAAITLRTVLNMLHGFGPTFNIDERVQAYTHPLWFFALTALAAVTGNIFNATFILSIATSVMVLWLFLTRVATRLSGAVVAAIAMIMSRAYVEFSTSGLENPLSHLIILLALLCALKVLEEVRLKHTAGFFLLCGLLYLNRPDLLVLMAPIALLLMVKARHAPATLSKAMLLGALPVVLWSLFSVYYYGFIFPNTAYAKLGAGIALDERLVQGGKYLLQTLHTDPITLACIAVGIILGARAGLFAAMLSAGMVAYLLYIMSIGGDFMEGRFLTAPLLLACVQIARCDLKRLWLYFIGAGVAALGLVGIESTLLSGSDFINFKIYPNGTADERGIYYPRTGLLSNGRDAFAAPDWQVGERKVQIICGQLGFSAIYAGPRVHYIDTCALADPLLARLPALYDPNWRIGHFVRQLPTDYIQSIALNQNTLADPATHAYYDSIRLVTRGELNDPARLKEIFRINTGRVPAPDAAIYRHQLIPRISGEHSAEAIIAVAELAHPVDAGPWDASGNRIFHESLEIALPGERSLSEIDLSVDHNDTYRIEVFTGQGFIPIADVNPVSQVGMARHRIKLDKPTPLTDRVRIVAVSGDGAYSLGHFLFR